MENRSYTINHEDATVSLYEDSKGVMKELLRLGYRKFILERDFKGKSMFTADFSNLGPVMFMSREGRYVRAQISERIIPGDVWVVDPYNEWWWEKRSVRSITAEEFKDYTPPKVVGPVQVPVLVSSTEDLLEALTRGDSYIKVSSGTHLVLTKDMSNYFNIYIDVTLAEVIDPTGLVGLALASWKFLLCAEAMDSWIFSTFKSIVRATFTYSEEQFMASMAEKPTTCSAPVAEETLMPEGLMFKEYVTVDEHSIALSLREGHRKLRYRSDSSVFQALPWMSEYTGVCLLIDGYKSIGPAGASLRGWYVAQRSMGGGWTKHDMYRFLDVTDAEYLSVEDFYAEVVPQPGYTPEKPQDASCEPWEPDTDTAAYTEPEADTEPHRPLDVVKEAFAKLEKETLSYGALADRMNQMSEEGLKRHKDCEGQLSAMAIDWKSANKSYRALDEALIKEAAGLRSDMVSDFDHLNGRLGRVEEASVRINDLSEVVKENGRLLNFSYVLIIVMAFNTILNWLL